MSLINDALRRAKQAQQEAPPPPTPDTQFRPFDPTTQVARHGVGLLLPALLAATALLGLLLFWELSHTPSVAAKSPLSVTARTLASSDAPVSLVEAPPAQPEVSAPSNASGLSKPAESVSGGPGSSNANVVAAASDQGDTNRPVVTEPAAPAPPPLKLQGIVYNPTRPSALINGRVIFLGDRVREYRVLAIHRDEVLLAGAGQTNVLSLEP